MGMVQGHQPRADPQVVFPVIREEQREELPFAAEGVEAVRPANIVYRFSHLCVSILNYLSYKKLDALLIYWLKGP